MRPGWRISARYSWVGWCEVIINGVRTRSGPQENVETVLGLWEYIKVYKDGPDSPLYCMNKDPSMHG